MPHATALQPSVPGLSPKPGVMPRRPPRRRPPLPSVSASLLPFGSRRWKALRRGCGRGCPGAQVPPEAHNHPRPGAPTHAPEAAAQAQYDYARCALQEARPAAGGRQSGLLHANGANNHVSILQEQVRSLPALAHLWQYVTDRAQCCTDFAERAPACPCANWNISGRLGNLLFEGRTHGFCVCTFRARDAEYFACHVVCPCSYLLWC
jgi:hypothetical protein